MDVRLRARRRVRRHALLPSLEAMLEPETLSRLVGAPIASVRRAPFLTGHSTSGSRFLAIETNDGRGPRFVVKLVSTEWDWVMRATADGQGREALGWTSGLFGRMPPEIESPIVGCAREGSGWAILMRDVSGALVPGGDDLPGAPIGEGDFAAILDALAAFHAAFWEEPEAADPALGYCSPWHHYAVLSLAAGHGAIDRPAPSVWWLRQAWDQLWPLIDPEVATVVRRLMADPAPLVAALARYPQTVVHGDPRLANLGIAGASEPRVIALDWHFLGAGVPGLDLAWFLGYGFRHPVDADTTIAWYQEGLARRLGSRFEEAWWRPQLELSLLGLLVRLGCLVAWDAVKHPDPGVRAWTRERLAWWSDRAREGIRRLPEDGWRLAEMG